MQHLSIERSKTESSTPGLHGAPGRSKSTGIPEDVKNVKQLREYLHSNKGFGELTKWR